jgi:hypothetical protein
MRTGVGADTDIGVAEPASMDSGVGTGITASVGVEVGTGTDVAMAGNAAIDARVGIGAGAGSGVDATASASSDGSATGCVNPEYTMRILIMQMATNRRDGPRRFMIRPPVFWCSGSMYRVSPCVLLMNMLFRRVNPTAWRFPDQITGIVETKNQKDTICGVLLAVVLIVAGSVSAQPVVRRCAVFRTVGQAAPGPSALVE